MPTEQPTFGISFNYPFRPTVKATAVKAKWCTQSCTQRSTNSSALRSPDTAASEYSHPATVVAAYTAPHYPAFTKSDEAAVGSAVPTSVNSTHTIAY